MPGRILSDAEVGLAPTRRVLSDADVGIAPAGPQLSGSAGYIPPDTASTAAPPRSLLGGLADYFGQEGNAAFVQPGRQLGHDVMEAYRHSVAQKPSTNPLDMIPGVSQGSRDFGRMAWDAANIPLAALSAPVHALAVRPVSEAISRLPIQAYDPTPTMGPSRPLDQPQTERALEGGINTALMGIGPGKVGPMPRIPQRVAPPLGPAAALRAEGVSLTPGERMGGFARAIEDKAQSAPILGDAIRGARMRGRQSLNRAVANRALAPIGETLPADVQVGTDAVAHVESRLGDAYKRAESLITNVTPDAEFASGITGIRNNLKGQPPSVLRQFDALVQDRVAARMAAGPLDGQAVQEIKSQLGELSADHIAAGGANATLGRRLADVADQVTALAGRSSPAFVQAQRAADAGWANFVRMRQASGMTGADAGVFTPSQLKTAVRTTDRSVGHGATARGSAPMADLANNAGRVMTPTIPNSGTADRYLGYGLVGAAVAPGHVGLPAAAALGAAAVPYLLMGRRIASAALRPGASPELLAASAARLKTLVASEPKLAPLYRTVLHRLGNAGPAALNLSGGTRLLESSMSSDPRSGQ